MIQRGKPIRLSNHARTQLASRGTSEEEIIRAIREAKWEKAELGKLEAKLNLTFQKEWNGKWYQTKQIRPIFAEEENEIVIVTVYVYYF